MIFDFEWNRKIADTLNQKIVTSTLFARLHEFQTNQKLFF